MCMHFICIYIYICYIYIYIDMLPVSIYIYVIIYIYIIVYTHMNPENSYSNFGFVPQTCKNIAHKLTQGLPSKYYRRFQGSVLPNKQCSEPSVITS